MYCSIISLKKEVWYLGATIDEKVYFNAHTEISRAKSLKCFSAIYPLLHSRSKLSTVNKLTLYKTVIRPKITYAAPAWICTNETNIKKLQRTQNKILKTILGLPRTFSTNVRHSLLKIDDIRAALKKLETNFPLKCRSSNFNIIRRIASVNDSDQP